jgi:hypothetical protein
MDKALDLTSSGRFFDENKRDRGRAEQITPRAHAMGRLTVLDVVTTEPSLASFLGSLDHSCLRVQSEKLDGISYMFEWASGYQNGAQIRIQGVLSGS